MICIENGALSSAMKEAAIFSFDGYTMPFSAAPRMQLVPGKVLGGTNPIVAPIVERGAGYSESMHIR
jgi:hypothetical protein